MKITPIRTHKITRKDTNILSILDQYLSDLSEKTVVVVTSKIVSICEGRIVKMGTIDKDELIKQEAQYYLPRSSSKYNVSLTINRNILAASAGVDESNGNGYYVLWPADPQRSANDIRGYLKRRFSLKEVGVIITDSKTTPLRWGVTGIALAYSGISPLKNYIGTKDIFGKIMEYTKTSVIDSLASAATVVAGEGKEQTPLAIIEDIPFIKFQSRNPTQKELNSLSISIKDDLYYPLLKNVKWRKGLQRRNGGAG